MSTGMEAIAALVPPLVVAVAFIAIARTALRHSGGSSGSTDCEDRDEPSGSAIRDPDGG